MLVLRKGFLSLAKLLIVSILQFENLIQIIRTSVTDKIVGYSIYALINLFTGR